MRIAIIGTYLPRRCGIATFTNDLYKSLNTIHADQIGIIALSNNTETIFPQEVKCIIEKDNLGSYQKAAEFINTHYDICIVQHEYGIFGGQSGHYIVELLRMLYIPSLTNLHTVLKKPTIAERTIIQQLALHSDRIMVMTNVALEILGMEYALYDTKICVIPHGVPTFTYNKLDAKKALKLGDKKIMLSFGLLGPNKGYETAIEAVAQINDPNFLYIILGATHPEIRKAEGEKYRKSLEQKVINLGLETKVVFVNQFVSDDLLGQYLKACDIFVSPYPNENQISSGTLTFALGAGCAVLSTPYLYAIDLLAEERGLLFNFGDALGLSHLVNMLLYDEELLLRYSKNGPRYTDNMQWNKIGPKIKALTNEVMAERLDNENLRSFFQPSTKLSS